MRTTSILLASLLLPLALPAQDSALTLKTNDPNAVRAILGMFNSRADVPKLEEGQVAVITLDDGGQPNVAVADGNKFFELHCRPDQLVDLFAQEMAQYEQMGQMMAGMGGAQMGLDFEDAAKIVTGVFAFPRQIAELHVSLPTDPEASKSLDLDVAINPKSDTWFAGLVESMKPNPKGVQMLPSDGAAMDAAINFDLPAAWEKLRPVFAPFAGMGQETKEDKAFAAAHMDKLMKTLDGTMSIVMGDGGLRSVSGLEGDVAKLREMTNDASYERVQVAAAQIGDQAEATFTPKAFEHRGVPVSRMVAIYDNPEMNPFANEDGELQTYTAVTDTAMVGAMFGASESEVKNLIDAVVDQKLKRKQLPPQSIAVMNFNVPAMMQMMERMSQGQMRADGEDIPETGTVDVKRTDKGLKLSIRAK